MDGYKGLTVKPNFGTARHLGVAVCLSFSRIYRSSIAFSGDFAMLLTNFWLFLAFTGIGKYRWCRMKIATMAV